MSIASLKLICGIRPSELARRQCELAAAALGAAHPELDVVMRIYHTRGDREHERPLPDIGGKGLFTTEIEAALRAGEIDLAVHSVKDLPIEESDDLCLGAVLEREDARDVLVSRHKLRLSELPVSPRVGTSSVRRAAQVLRQRPDAIIVDIRGNVDTRLRKADTSAYDAVVFAAAGLKRLGLENAVSEWFDYEEMTPAPGQGALAVQCRRDDERLLALLSAVHHLPSWQAVTAERTFLQELGGGCASPVGAYAAVNGRIMTIAGLILSRDGSQSLRRVLTHPAYDPLGAGRRLADLMLGGDVWGLVERPLL